MTNEEKAFEIMRNNEGMGDKCHYAIALEMTDWKDEQAAQEKQQFIGKACEWWKNEFKTHEMKYKDSKDWYNSKVERFK